MEYALMSNSLILIYVIQNIYLKNFFPVGTSKAARCVYVVNIQLQEKYFMLTMPEDTRNFACLLI